MEERHGVPAPSDVIEVKDMDITSVSSEGGLAADLKLTKKDINDAIDAGASVRLTANENLSGGRAMEKALDAIRSDAYLTGVDHGVNGRVSRLGVFTTDHQGADLLAEAVKIIKEQAYQEGLEVDTREVWQEGYDKGYQDANDQHARRYQNLIRDADIGSLQGLIAQAHRDWESDVIAERDSLKQQLEDKTRECEVVSSQRDYWKRDRDSMVGENADLRHKIIELENSGESVDDRLWEAYHQGERETRQNWYKENRDLQAKLNHARAETSKRDVEISELKTDRNIRTRDLAQAEAERDSAIEGRTAWKKSAEDLQVELDWANNELAHVRNIRDRLEAERDEANARADAFMAQNAKLVKERDDALSDMAESDSKLKTVAAARDVWCKHAQSLGEKNIKLIDERDAAQAELEEVKAALDIWRKTAMAMGAHKDCEDDQAEIRTDD